VLKETSYAYEIMAEKSKRKRSYERQGADGRIIL
jgi:hypothetical protein